MSADRSLGGSFTFAGTGITVRRIGYGAMQLAGPHVFGPPADEEAARAVLREAVALGIDHIDTSDFYGPHVTNRLIRQALAPYPEGLTIVTKVGFYRDAQGGWIPDHRRDALVRSVEDNLRNLGLDAIDIVNLRVGGAQGPEEAPIGDMLATLADLKEQGLVRAIGVSNVTRAQLAEARASGPLACVQNLYNLARRDDDPLIDDLEAAGIAYVPYFPLGGFSPLQSSVLDEVAAALGAPRNQVALAWLLQRAPNILLIPGTESIDHLRENVGAAELEIPGDLLARLDGIADAG